MFVTTWYDHASHISTCDRNPTPSAQLQMWRVRHFHLKSKELHVCLWTNVNRWADAHRFRTCSACLMHTWVFFSLFVCLFSLSTSPNLQKSLTRPSAACERTTTREEITVGKEEEEKKAFSSKLLKIGAGKKYIFHHCEATGRDQKRTVSHPGRFSLVAVGHEHHYTLVLWEMQFTFV